MKNIYTRRFNIFQFMVEGNKLKNYIIYFICLLAVFVISGVYSKPEYLVLISFFVPIAFIPLMLLIAYKGLYNRTNFLFYVCAIISSLLFFISMIYFRIPDALNAPGIEGSYIAILMFAFLISLTIHIYSYRLIRLFGIRIDDDIVKNVKTISCTIQNDAEKIKNLVKFFLTEILSFEYVRFNISIFDKFVRGDNEFTLIKYSENKNTSALLISYIMFYNDQDGIRAFDNESINSFSIILEKLVGGSIVEPPEEVITSFSNYFSRYRPIIKDIREYFGKKQVNWRDILNPVIIIGLVIFFAVTVFNLDKIIRYASNLNLTTVAVVVTIIASVVVIIYHVLKMLGKIK